MHAIWLILKGLGLFAVASALIGWAFVAGRRLALPVEIQRENLADNATLLPAWLSYSVSAALGGAVTVVTMLGMSGSWNGWLALGIGATLGGLSGLGAEKLCWSRLTPAMLAARLDRFREQARQRQLNDCLRQLRSELPASRSQAAERLAELGQAGAVPALAALLETEPEQNVREAATIALGRIGGADAIAALVARLEDWPRVAQAAARGLRTLNWAPASLREHVRLALATEDKDTLASLAPQAVDELLGAVRNQADHYRSGAANALGYSGDARIGTELARLLDDSFVQKDTALALTRLGWSPSTDEERLRLAMASGDFDAISRLGQIAVPALVAATKPHSGHSLAEVCQAAHALGRIGGQPAVTALEEMLNASWSSGWEREVREAAVAGLVGCPGSEAARSLLASMRDRRLKHYKKEVMKTMAESGGASQQALVELVTHRDSDLGQAAAMALAEAGWRPETPEANLAFLSQTQRWDELAALGPAAADPLREAAAHPASGQRRFVLEAIGRHGAAWAREMLVAGLADQVYAVRKAAATALRNLGLDAGLGSSVEVKPTPGMCAFCGSRLENIPVTMFMDDTIGRTMISQGPAAADVLLRAACECQCGLPACYACMKHGKWQCPDCGRQTG